MANLKINLRNYIYYKFVNAIFNGLSTGAVMIIYGLLQPSVFSVGGLILALGILIVSRNYTKLMKMAAYYKVTLFTEAIILTAMALVLLFPKGEFLSLIYYCLFTLVFIFGTYLMRFESNLFRKPKVLSIIDSVKQVGNLLGLAISWLFYEILKLINLNDTAKDSWQQIYSLHWILVGTQALVFILAMGSFRKSLHRN